MRRGCSDAARRPRRPIRPAGSRCSSCRRTRARAAAACPLPSGRTRTRPSGSRSTSIAPAPPAFTRDDRARAPMARGAGPDRARGLRLHAAGREQHARDAVLLERSAGALPRPQPRRRRTTALPIATASSWFTPTTRARLQAAWDRFSGADFTRDREYEGPGTGVGNVVVPANLLRAGTDFDDRASAWAKSDSWMTLLRAEAAAGASRSSTCRTSRGPASIRGS